MTYCSPCNEHGLRSVRIVEDPNEIIDICCEYLKVDRKSISSRRRDRNLVFARQMTMHILFHDKNLDMTLRAIGRMFGNRDHSTVIHAVNTINNYFDVYHEVYAKAVNLHRKIYGSIKYLELGKKVK